jgi:hypothetical protein
MSYASLLETLCFPHPFASTPANYFSCCHIWALGIDKKLSIADKCCHAASNTEGKKESPLQAVKTTTKI